jgi:DNA-binding CsgD family transcriptional regulator
MQSANELLSNLAQAESFEAAGALVASSVASMVGASTVNVFPLFAGARPEVEAVLCSTEVCPDALRRASVDIMPISDRELGTVVDQFPGELRVMDSAEQIGWRRLHGSMTYNDGWRPWHLERQALALLGSQLAPLGFICACRKFSERPFTGEELHQLDAIRGAFEPRLRQFATSRQGPAELILRSLQTALPFPGGIFDQRGHALWLSESAEQALAIRATKVGSVPIGAGTRSELAHWRDAVLYGACSSADPAPSWCYRGVTVRRISLEPEAPLFLVIATGNRANDLKRLTTREGQVAELISRGHSVLNVSRNLGLTEGTVRNHLKHIYRKLGINSKLDLARIVLGAGPCD